MEFPLAAATAAVTLALAEDASVDDITTRWSVPEGLRARADIVARQCGVVAGVRMVAAVLHRLDPEVVVEELVADGDRVTPGEVLIRLSGRARSLITGERTALNFLQHLSGIATLTWRYTDRVHDLPVKVLDTRKTAPGLRVLDKYAVTAGGGHNHRLDLSAMVLLKENHIAAAGGVTAAIHAVRKGMAEEGRDVLIDIEVKTVAEAKEAVHAQASWIMLDDMSVEEIEQVVRAREQMTAGLGVLLEASGTITLERLRPIAQAGVDMVSVGALTHSAPGLDVSMLITGS
ncbi:carboxylating nicotinate-nucleotide diphosphorylase [Streptomyces sp. NPDC048650]|uniref:carboxylating nicotinate-nucleotide diphosphorylase n=1 Tax=unclassified Streptomyces TaxID=2593676 RepID=UPI003714C31E